LSTLPERRASGPPRPCPEKRWSQRR
jgi:hypothetical protein